MDDQYKIALVLLAIGLLIWVLIAAFGAIDDDDRNGGADVG